MLTSHLRGPIKRWSAKEKRKTRHWHRTEGKTLLLLSSTLLLFASDKNQPEHKKQIDGGSEKMIKQITKNRRKMSRADQTHKSARPAGHLSVNIHFACLENALHYKLGEKWRTQTSFFPNIPRQSRENIPSRVRENEEEKNCASAAERRVFFNETERTIIIFKKRSSSKTMETEESALFPARLSNIVFS